MEKLTHLTHVEDFVLIGENHVAANAMMCILDNIMGAQEKCLLVTKKYDGAPSVVFGRHPENRKIFVGTKSVFNKRTPKINYTKEDLIANHGTHPGLVDKLWSLLEELQHERIEGVYQGDIMFSGEDLGQRYDEYFFQPNVIEYRCKIDSGIGDTFANTDIAIVVHTKYETEDGTFAGLRPKFDFSYEEFTQGGDAILGLNPRLENIEAPHTISETMAKYLIESITDVYNFKYNEHIFKRHQKLLKMYMNHVIREKITDWTDPYNYHYFLYSRGEFSFCDVKDNLDEFKALLQTAQDLQHIKEQLMQYLGTIYEDALESYIDNKPTDGEGYVIHYNDVSMKMVRRNEFSAANFANSKFV